MNILLGLDWESIIVCSIIFIGAYIGFKVENKVFGNKK